MATEVATVIGARPTSSPTTIRDLTIEKKKNVLKKVTIRWRLDDHYSIGHNKQIRAADSSKGCTRTKMYGDLRHLTRATIEVYLFYLNYFLNDGAP